MAEDIAALVGRLRIFAPGYDRLHNAAADALEQLAASHAEQAREIERLNEHCLLLGREIENLRNDVGAAERELAEARRMLAQAIIKVAELPGPTKDTIPENQLNKVTKFTALQLGHAMGIADAIECLRHAAHQRGEEG